MNIHPAFEDDSMTQHGANLLANRIRRYWRDNGHEVMVWTERMHNEGQGGRGTVWHVRSDLINGLPQPGLPQVNQHG